MENKVFDDNKNLEILESNLQKKIQFAKENALSEREYEEISEKEFEMQQLQNKRELTDEEVNFYFNFREKNNKASIEIETITEAKRVMEILGFDQDSLLDTIAHENAHGNVAEKIGANHLGYKFVVIRLENGYAIQPQANIYIPDEWSKDRQNEALLQITQAPEDYDNTLSSGDRRDIDGLGLLQK